MVSVNSELKEIYCISNCVLWIQENEYTKVALQFPDELLRDAPSVSKLFEMELGFLVYILGDTTFGDCCVDEVTAEHIGAQAIIHFGRTCLSPSHILPVLYVLGPAIPVNQEQVINRLKDIDGPESDEFLIFVCDTRCLYIMDSFSKLLEENFPNMLFSSIVESKKSSFVHENLPSFCEKDATLINNFNDLGLKSESFCGRKIVLPSGKCISDYDFVYLGPNSPSVLTLSLRFSQKIFYRVDCDGHNLVVGDSTKQVMNRSKKLEQIKEAKIIGILIGTLGIEKYSEIITKTKKLIRSSGKKCYTFVIGKPNEPKLANIVGVDVFCYIACPESTLFDRNDNTYLYKYLVTPWELNVSLNSSTEWNLNFELNFKELLEGGRLYTELEEPKTTINLEPRRDESMSLMARPEGTLCPIHVNAAGDILKSLSWQGLDPNHPPPTEVGVVLEGRKGIASQYSDERTDLK